MVETKNKDSKPKGFDFNKYEIMKVHLKFETPEYIENISNQILKGYSYPILRILLKNFRDDDLFDYYREDPNKCSEDLTEIIIEELKMIHGIRTIIKKGQLKGIHFIPDISDFEEIIPEITEFSKSLVDYLRKLVRIKCRFLDYGLHKKYIATKLYYQCRLCGAEIDIDQEIIIRGRYIKPKYCTDNRCKAKAQTDFKLIKEKAEKFEAGYFVVGDLDQSNTEREKVCYMFKNYNYFYNKIKELNPNDEIEILGVIKLDYSDLDSKKDNHEILDYIEVLDIKQLESKNYINAIYIYTALMEEMTEAIIRILSDDDFRKQLENNIINYINQDVSWKHVAGLHIEAYRSYVRVPYGKARHVFWE